MSDDSERSWIDQRLEDPETRTAYQKEVARRIAELELELKASQAMLPLRDRLRARIARLEGVLRKLREHFATMLGAGSLDGPRRRDWLCDLDEFAGQALNDKGDRNA